MAATLTVRFLGDDRDLKRSLNAVEGHTKKTGSVVGGLGKTLVGFGAAAGAINLAKDAFAGLRSEAEATRTLEATLKSMGRTTIDTKSITDFAATLQANSDFIEEDIIAAAGVMATFGNIADRDLNRANQAAADLAARFGMDLSGATVMLGKALNDPIKGLTSLGRAGVQFTQGQKDQIAAMVEAGDVAGAQAIIYEELGKQTTGAAAAQQDSFERLSDTVGEAAETFLAQLMPAIEKVVGWAITAIEVFGRMDPTAKIVIGAITGITAVLWLLHAHPIVFALSAIIGTLVFLEERFGIVSAAGRGLADAFGFLRDVGTSALQFLLDRVLSFVGGALDAFATFLEFLPGHSDMAAKLRGAADEIYAFRDAANTALSGIRDKTINVTIGTSGMAQRLMGMGGSTGWGSFHSGGIVPGPPTSETFALLRGGERVMPSGAGAGGGQVNIFVAGSVVAERDLVETVRRGMAGGRGR